ncbi:DUF934 domain-containing protein [Sphingopyxis sp. YF1]|uniref:DUF934 domain-containing protein n=1 Tax=Sphingopyxis sp. YF1 TaxID=2482763 RepID=UPI001F61B345|nr:DUF934 domain-containing protein [Sphingopyxis sp. YF1]UNU42278.1 DUF934 domain-containing protein [Sphingopyxis sp. YF1]
MASFRYRDDQPHEEPAVTLDAFLEQPDATAVRVEAGEDARKLIPHLDRLELVEISFPRFRDGRGFSSARILREAGYTGELRAEGDVLIDLLFFMRRCGFDSFVSQHSLNPADVEAALNRYTHVYQDATDAAVPIWKLRHG